MDQIAALQRAPKQPIEAAAIDDARLKIETVIAITGLSKASIYRKVNSGDFPKPIKDGKRCTRWRAGAVTAWLRAGVAVEAGVAA